ncbi:hypothetical protein K2173_018700 [Erythroxylum novogranatense]|uniref:Trichome birefringence-like C-terminal domain-containing protein n=1 Tax=Erythroxylum novogranatense TaxID=1862640 RepID=A0AAV8SAX8_9ROSI|nr:hypothetical protein K2173_018700 [Erythroxylum novogranatense]
MAKREHQLKKIPRFLLLSLLCFISIFLLLSLSRRPSLSNQTLHFKPQFHPHHQSSLHERYDNTCKEIFKGWNCIANNKSNPKDCDLSAFDPHVFLHTYRDTIIGTFTILYFFCFFKMKSYLMKRWLTSSGTSLLLLMRMKIVCTFVCNIAVSLSYFHVGALLACYHIWSANASGGVLESLRVDAPLKFNPVKSPMIFFENGQLVIPSVTTEVSFDKASKHMVQYDDKGMQPGGIKFFRTQSPRLFEGGDWDEGGSWPQLQPLLLHHVEELFSMKNNGTNVESRLVNQHIFKAIEGCNFHILDITCMSEFRADAHPSIADGKRHDDCMHWCLTGITGTWNDVLIMNLNRIKSQS